MSKKFKFLSTIALVSLLGVSSCAKNNNVPESSTSSSTSSSSSSSTTPDIPEEVDYSIYFDYEMSYYHADGEHITINGLKDEYASLTDVVIPNKFDGKEYPIDIKADAFKNNSSIKSVKFSKNVKTIDYKSFKNASSLEKLEVDSENPIYYSQDNCIITRDGKRLVKGCKTSIIPNDVLQVAGFYGSNIESVNIPASVTYIYGDAFAYCHDLKKITVDSNNSSYKDCNSNVIVNSSKSLVAGCSSSIIPTDSNIAVKLDSYAFAGSSIKEISIPNNILFIGDYTFFASDLENVTFADDSPLTTLMAAFENCKFKTFKIPKNVTSFNLSYNPYLETLDLNEICEFDMSLLVDCTNFKTLNINNNKNVMWGGAGLLYSKQANGYLGDKIIWLKPEFPNVAVTGLKTIGKYAFSNNSVLNSISFSPLNKGDTIKADYISEGIFTNLNLQLLNLTNCEAVNRMVINCHIKKVIIPSNFKLNYNSIFKDCVIDNVVIPQDVSVLSHYAFDNTIIKNVEFTGSQNNYKVVDDKVYSYDGTKLYFVFGDSKEIVVPEGVSDIEHLNLYGDNVKYTFPTTLKTISSQAFSGKHEESEFIVPKNVTSLKQSFYDSDYSNIILNEGLTTIGESAFRTTKNLKSIVIPNTVTSLGRWAFMGSSIASIQIPQGLTTIGGNVFNSCTNLRYLSFPKSVSNIGEGILAWSSVRVVEIKNPKCSISPKAFISAPCLQEIRFDGTLDQFKAIFSNNVSSFTTYLSSCIDNLTIKYYLSNGDSAFIAAKDIKW